MDMTFDKKKFGTKILSVITWRRNVSMRNYYKVTTITYFSSSIPSYPAGVSGPLNLCITSEMFGSSFCAVMITSLDHDVQISVAAPPVIIFSSEPPQAQGRVSLAGTVQEYLRYYVVFPAYG